MIKLLLMLMLYRALVEYRATMKAGPDGRPDWVPRKFCNFITEVLVVCTIIIHSANYTADDVLYARTVLRESCCAIQEKR